MEARWLKEVPMHIGLIGGIGPAATDHYYRGLIARNISSGTLLDLTTVHADARELIQNITRGDAGKQAEIFAHLIRRLSAAGASAAAITSLGGHFCSAELEAISPLPILNALPAIDLAIRQKNLKRIGILGTRAVMETHLYRRISSAEVVLPEERVLNQVHKSYVEMAISGHATDAQRELFFAVGRDLCRSQGVEAIVLGGTDLFLAFNGQDYGFPVIDCANVHIDSIYQYSVG
jgi:aspartate racemase